MATVNFYDRNGTLRGLPLDLIIDTTQYADFHKRSETTYPDITIDELDLPFVTLTNRNGLVVNLTIVGGGDSGSGIVQGFSSSATVLNESPTRVKDLGIITPRVASDSKKYDFSTTIDFDNNISSTTFVVLYSGSIPPGLTIQTGTISNSYVNFYGNIRDELFGLNLCHAIHDYENLSEMFLESQQSVILDVEYIDNLIDRNVLSNPVETFALNDTMINIGDGGAQGRTIEAITRYVESTAVDTVSGNFIIGTEYYITRRGNTSVLAIGSSSNDVGTIFTASGSGTGNGTATSEIKTKIYFNTYIKKFINTGVETVEPFKLSQKRKFNSNNRELPLDDTWRGYVKNTSGVYAQYDDLVYENSQNDRFLKTYTFTLRMYTDSSLTTLLDHKTFTISCQASAEALRDNYMFGKGIAPAKWIEYNRIN